MFIRPRSSSGFTWSTIATQVPASGFRIVFDDGRLGEARDLKVFADSVGGFTRLHGAGVDGEASGKLGEEVGTFLAKLAKDGDGFELEELRPRRVLQSLLNDIDRAVELHEADLAARVLDGRNSLVDEAGIHGRLLARR